MKIMIKQIISISTIGLLISCGGGNNNHTHIPQPKCKPAKRDFNTSVPALPSIKIKDSDTLKYITLVPNIHNLHLKTSQQYHAMGFFQSGNDVGHSLDISSQVNWGYVTNTNVFSVSKGLVKIMKSGIESLDVNYQGIHTYFEINVNDYPLASINITSESGYTMLTNSQLQLKATGYYNDAYPQDITQSINWLSESPDIADVDNYNTKGMVVSQESAGTAVIRGSMLNSDNRIISESVLINVVTCIK